MSEVISTGHETLISLRDISMCRDRREVLKDINFDIHRGDFVAITGPNGGGKTTLLRIVLRLLRPTSGSVTYFDPAGKPTRRLEIGYLPQKNMIDSRFPITVSEVVASGLMGSKLSAPEVESATSSMLETVGLTDHAGKCIGELSGGQLQRALLGRALISKPEVLVLDEPLSYVDKQFEAYIYRLMEDLARSTTILLVSHEMSTIAGIANRHLIIDHTLHECHSPHHHVHYECDSMV
ncbi:MAG: metal ABC transporter ATP-binding protein [Duncaniella sp.]|nr:metal ABC transporter ATP-binding protein [Duncaniella sp.]